MKAAEHDLLRRVEDRHWWCRLLRSQVQNVVTGKLKTPARLLDAGCGTGGMLRQLQKCGTGLEMCGIDLSPDAIRHCHERGVPAALGTLHDIPFQAACFDMVLCLDVLYHKDIEEDRAMSEMHRVLKDGGWLVLNLPAFECLRGAHDEAVDGARRYRPGRVGRLLGLHGFECERCHFWNAWPFLPMLAWRQLSRRQRPVRQQQRSDLAFHPAWLDRLLYRLGSLDALLCRELHLPLGSSIFTIARKTSRKRQGGRS